MARKKITLTPEQELLRKLNKKLNSRLLSAERRGANVLKSYQETKELAELYGTQTRKGIARFKERVATLTPSQVKEQLRISKRALGITGYIGKASEKKIKEISRRFKKGGHTLSSGLLSDVIELERSSSWSELKKYYSSSEIIDIIQERGTASGLSTEVDDYLTLHSTDEIDEDELREILIEKDGK